MGFGQNFLFWSPPWLYASSVKNKNKKQLVKKFWGRILDLAWLKFAVATL
jgi:hypothetical protein